MSTLKQNLAAVGSSVAAISVATSAMADGSAVVGPTYVPAADSDNPFVGFYMGGSLSVHDGRVPGEDDPYELRGGGIAGAFFGFNHAINDSFLVGAELNVFGPQQIQEVGSTSANYTLNALLEARARVGYLVNDNLMAYGFLGVTTTSRTGCCSGRTYALYGTNIGLGADYMVSDEFSIGAEITSRNLNAYDDWDFPDGDSSGITLRAAFHF